MHLCVTEKHPSETGYISIFLLLMGYFDMHQIQQCQPPPLCRPYNQKKKNHCERAILLLLLNIVPGTQNFILIDKIDKMHIWMK